MSLTPASPLIVSWMEKGLEWRYFWNPVMRPFTIPANGQVQVPSERYTFTAPEGTLVSFSAAFDHPACGWRIEFDPEFDTGITFTVNNAYLLGTLNQPWGVFSTVPPQTPPGLYGLTIYKELSWKNWMRLYLLNTDSIDHRCIGYAFDVALLKEPRKDEAEKVS